MNLKPFNLEKALAGDPVVTRDGRKVTEIAHFKTFYNSQNIIAVLNGQFYSFFENGQYIAQDQDTEFDLRMAPKIVKKSGWLNVYPNNAVGYTVHPTKESADINKCDISNRVACIFIEWEEEEE